MQKPQRLPSLPVLLSWSVLVVIILGALGVVLLQGSLRTSQDTRNKADVGQQAVVLDGCVLTGCSGEICAEEASELVSACVVKPEHACYRQSGVCRKQADGKCGWTQTAELTACLANAGSATPSASASPSATPKSLDTCATDADCPTGQTCGVIGCPPGTKCLVVRKACLPKGSPSPSPKTTASATPRPTCAPRPACLDQKPPCTIQSFLPFCPASPRPSASVKPIPTPSASPTTRISCQSDANCPAGQTCVAQSCPAGTQCFYVPRYCMLKTASPSPTTRTCSTDAQCGPGQECYQPPMPPCPAGLACAQVMPPRVCRPKASPSVSPSPSASPSTTGLLGDINGDGKVDLIDYSLLRQEFLTSAKNSKADLNKDTKVDLVDYSIFIQELKK